MKTVWNAATACCRQPRVEDFLLTRRQFLNKAGAGFGAMSVAALAGWGLLPGMESLAAENAATPLAPKKPHFKAKAKRVLHIFAAGAPSQVDTWDPKPKLKELD